MSWYSKTQPYDISGSKIDIPSKPSPPPSSSDSGRGEMGARIREYLYSEMQNKR